MHLQCLIEHRAQANGLHVDHAILILQRTFRYDEFASRHYQALPLIEVRRHDDIRDSGLIFHRDEDETLGSTRTLPCDDETGRRYEFAVPARS